MDPLATRFERFQQRLADAAHRFGRDPATIGLLAVSKRHPPSAVRALHDLGQRAFGENYVSEALEKMATLQDLDLEWHYIGPIQSNKTREIAEHFDWVQSIDREKVARRLSEQRPPELGDLHCLVQVRIGGEASKSGCEPAAAAVLAQRVTQLPGLRFRGLMAIPPPSDSFDRQRAWFAELRALNEELVRMGLPADTLSMGMTDDLEAAVAEGATMVRVGTALFGPRPEPA